jgi:hypothetical protein
MAAQEPAFGPERPLAAQGQGPFARLPRAPSGRGLQHDQRAGLAAGASFMAARLSMAAPGRQPTSDYPVSSLRGSNTPPQSH